MTDLLTVTELTRSYGSFVALDRADLTVAEGARHALIGPNGAGKTTLLNLIAGTDLATSGRIAFAGRDITWQRPHRRSRGGIARTFQHPSVVPVATVLDNVLLGAWHHHTAAPWRRAGRRRIADDCRAILETVGLTGLEHRQAGELSHGRRRMLDLAVALAGRPRLLLLDEPAAGLTDADVTVLLAVLRDLSDDVAVLLVEHNLDVVAAFARTVTVLHHGRPLVTGTPAEIQADPAVREAYLGRRKVAETA
ncbi:ABC transporter ATP-binding protein [Yinghuangia seranimata]|uniref:ABC transporter ATP-binding protein n=1 Tax=Yinghuangia seranimata TaxID=408067 RepID=UPI00248C4C6B|nr:ABC transporter ATP-binding protein [Yinghuangia seranimata]MDI2129913.1 ABC transporter ATP-binding protein [Yinghuangia seranimata]